jgi:hypothetical protein
VFLFLLKISRVLCIVTSSYITTVIILEAPYCSIDNGVDVDGIDRRNESQKGSPNTMSYVREKENTTIHLNQLLSCTSS